MSWYIIIQSASQHQRCLRWDTMGLPSPKCWCESMRIARLWFHMLELVTEKFVFSKKWGIYGNMIPKFLFAWKNDDPINHKIFWALYILGFDIARSLNVPPKITNQTHHVFPRYIFGSSSKFPSGVMTQFGRFRQLIWICRAGGFNGCLRMFTTPQYLAIFKFNSCSSYVFPRLNQPKSRNQYHKSKTWMV